MVKLDGSGNAVRDDKGRVIPVVDYPYAQDGLDIWYAMRAWFGNYLGLYYKDGEQGKQVSLTKQHTLSHHTRGLMDLKMRKIIVQGSVNQAVFQNPVHHVERRNMSPVRT